jgi:ABC-type nitrate/sulfonate/bicarbonate transport system ATPase subunit
MSERATLEARGLWATRPGPDGPREVLHDVSFTLARGEAVALVGPSGCGKSTLLGAVAGLEPLDAGEVLVDGAPAPERLGRLTLMPQRDALLPWRTAGDNVALAARLAGRGRAEARRAADAALTELGLLDHAEHYPHALSGGMRQRVSLARTLAAGGDAWLLDEPFGALDALTRAKLQADLDRERRARGASVLLVTHDLDEALLLSDRVLVSSPRPMRIVAEVPVRLDGRRDLATTADPAFGRLKLTLLEALADVGALA